MLPDAPASTNVSTWSSIDGECAAEVSVPWYARPPTAPVGMLPWKVTHAWDNFLPVAQKSVLVMVTTGPDEAGIVDAFWVSAQSRTTSARVAPVGNVKRTELMSTR